MSDSGSAYWDMEQGVIRCSDHWAGHNGCTGQASCVWGYSGFIAPGAWATGYCAYSDFRPRLEVPIFHSISAEDKAAAELLHSAGGALPYQDWLASGLEVPPWAQKVFPGPALIPPAARALFRKTPGLRHAVSADPNRIGRIREGAARIKIGSRLSLPEDLSEISN